MKSIQNYHLNGKKVLLRVDFNVPQDENLNVTDTTRISAVKPTIDKIISDGGSIILMTHLGRPKGVKSEKYSLKNIIPEIEKILERKIQFSENSIGEDVKILSNELKAGQILLLENLRFHEEEELGDENFAKELSHLGDIYVNDAFGTAHRKHASTAVIAQFFPETKFFGLLMAKELEAIDKVLKNGKKPITAVLGGSKVSSKITIIENILPVVDNLIIGGGMSFTFVKAQGGSIGTSIVEEDKLDLALDILQTAKNLGVNIFLPVDVICADEFSNTANTKEVDIYDIPENWMGMDAGPKTRLIFHDVILSSKTILWNGPLGVFEMENFANGTISLGESIEEATLQGAFSLVGGGDSVSFVKSNGFDDKVSYVSTGGGAMLESLEGLELPGVAAINS